jgi:ferric-dicitrate binding protein FerR (iron transport regulator)
VEPIVIKAPFGQTITTALPDHSIVQLNSGTTLTYNRSFGWVDRRVKLNGEAFFIVKGSSQPFEVVTNNSIIKSVNTKFNVRAWNTEPGKETVVTLVKGKLDFAPKADPQKSVTLLSGQTSRIVKNSPQPSEPEIANVIHTISWRNNGLSFDSQPLSVIFGEMERRYNILIRTTNTNILQDSLTIFIARPTGPRDVLNNICQAANLKYNTTDKGYIVSRN